MNSLGLVLNTGVQAHPVRLPTTNLGISQSVHWDPNGVGAPQTDSSDEGPKPYVCYATGANFHLRLCSAIYKTFRPTVVFMLFISLKLAKISRVF